MRGPKGWVEGNDMNMGKNLFVTETWCDYVAVDLPFHGIEDGVQGQQWSAAPPKKSL